MSKELSEQQKIFLDAYFELIQSGMDRHAAAREAHTLAGYSVNSRPIDILRPLKEHIVERAIEELSMVLPTTVRKVEGVMNDPMQEGSKTILEAAASIMDRAGVIKKQQSEVTIRQPEGIIVLPPKDKE